ncbi:lantibiotic dehydratase C-terminal domain-containing protein [Kitasatospora sp. NPDC056783]|uniref:lantibiotic dehydratase C-terminal domain-containing protein n=1 Tax=Kitasatospora sp. NPDC056783 TaxID=3345943 RepID=UPI0036C75809
MSDPAEGQGAVNGWDVVLYHYQPDKARALREAVLPLAGRLAAEGSAVHVERHWKFGPHLRLRLRGPEARVAEAACRAAETLRQWADTHPSVADRSDEELLAEAAVAGRAELVAPPYGPLVPDNTVVAAPVDPAAESRRC